MKYFKMMFVVLFLSILLTPFLSFASVRVKGHYRNNGTYVQPYYRSNPNIYKYDNYSTYGNYNPNSGKMGTKRSYGW